MPMRFSMSSSLQLRETSSDGGAFFVICVGGWADCVDGIKFIWTAVTRHRFWRFADLSAKQSRVQRLGVAVAHGSPAATSGLRKAETSLRTPRFRQSDLHCRELRSFHSNSTGVSVDDE